MGLIAPGSRGSIPVDYTEENQNNYCRTWMLSTRLALKERWGLRLLQHMPYETVNENLPSWCPNLASQPDASNPLYPVATPFPGYIFAQPFAGVREIAAKFKETSSSLQFPYPDVLRIEGAVVDEIQAVVKGPCSNRNGDKYAPEEWGTQMGLFLNQCHSMLLEGGKDEPSVADTENALCRTILAASDGHCEVLSQVSYTMIKKTISATDFVEDEIYNVLWERLNHVWEARAFFSTKQGRIGVGHQTILPRDKVCVLDGAQPCYILRPRDCGLHWTLKYHAYTYGLMSGQVFDLIDRGDARLEYFDIV